MKGNKKTVFFSDVPGSIWIEIQSKITERYSDEVRNYYTKFGEAYLRKNRLDDGGFYSFSACMKRLGLYDFLRDLFKMIDFLASKPKYEAFYDYAYKLTGATIGANVLMNYSNLFAPAPVGNNLEGAKKLEEKLNQLYASELQ